jgi:ATP-binding cassette subfamily F protein 3
MAIVTLQDIHKSFGPEIVLDGLTLDLHDGEKVGLVGPNGCGKTTILKLILGTIEPDIGQVFRKRNLRCGYLPQEPVFSGERSLIEEMHAGFESILAIQKRMLLLAEKLGRLVGSELEAPMKEYDRLHNEFELAGGYDYETRTHAILAGLGFEDKHYDLKTTALSGGQLSRLGLALVLIKETDLLLLDEPTNHLDLQATVWLEKFLASYEGAVVIISHDRFLLDNVVSKIITVDNKRAHVWSGNYTTYVEERQKLELQQQREYESKVEFVHRTRDFIARNKDQEGMRKVARGRKHRLERLLRDNPDFLDKPQHLETIKFGFAEPAKQSDLIIRAENLCKQFDSVTLFKNLTFDVLGGGRLGITGPNGTGKSTLIKMALGQMEPTAGTIRMGKSLRVGYLDQQPAQPNTASTVLEEVQAAAPKLTGEKLRGKLAAFLFRGEDVFKKVRDLSGGQQNRLILCKLVLSEPDVLLLDEPTNHLDIPSKEMLETALREYSGTLIVVSHDRFFLNQTIDKLLVIGLDELGKKKMGEFEFVTGNYSEYAALLEKRALHYQRQAELAPKAPKPKRAKRIDVPKKTTPKDLVRFAMWSIDKIETAIIELEEQVSQMHERFGDEEIYKDPAKLKELKSEFHSKRVELDILYRAYEHRLEK